MVHDNHPSNKKATLKGMSVRGSLGLCQDRRESHVSGKLVLRTWAVIPELITSKQLINDNNKNGEFL